MSYFGCTRVKIQMQNTFKTIYAISILTFPLHLLVLSWINDIATIHFVQGQIYHRIDQLVPKEDGSKHLQQYFYDTDADLQQRFRRSPNLDKELIRKLVSILSSNPYAQIFRTLVLLQILMSTKLS